MAFQTEAVVTTPADFTERTIVLPDNSLHRLVVTVISSWFVSQFRHRELLPVVSVKGTHESAREDILPGNTENKIACSLAIEILMVNQLGNAICIEQLDTIDKLQIGTIDSN